MRWIALFSQTGSEICNISERIERKPDIILTNNANLSEIDGRIRCDHTMRHSEIETFLKENVVEGDIITLHGYLRILSPNVCKLPCKILNGHPAPIHIYPELKGKDMQEVQYIMKHKYDRIGTVIHEVIAELDSGDILYYNDCENNLSSIDDAYRKLKLMSLDLWIRCMKDIL